MSLLVQRAHDDTTYDSLFNTPTESGQGYPSPTIPKSTPIMQVEPQPLSAVPFGDAMAINTDDEMVDYEVEMQRDEDYDIDLEHPETYEEEAEGSVIMGDYEQNKGSDNDDEMLDDEAVDMDPKHGSSDVQITYDEEPVQEVAFETTETYVETTVPYEVEEPAHAPVDAPILDPVESAPTIVEHVQEVVPGAEETSFAQHVQQEEESFFEENEVTEEAVTVASVHSDHSSTTLKQEQGDDEAAQGPANQEQGVEQEPVHEESAENYPHPVVVYYDNSTVSLFPPLDIWSADTPVGQVFKGLPQDFFLQDTDVCDKGLDQLFNRLREVLGDSITADDELWVDLELLGLSFGEDNVACTSVSLRNILDLHNNLHRQDGVEIPPPVELTLYTGARFNRRLEFIGAVLEEGKGLRDCLQLLNLADSLPATETLVEETPAEAHDENVNATAPAAEDPEPAAQDEAAQPVPEQPAVYDEDEVEIFDDEEQEEAHHQETQPVPDASTSNADSQEHADGNGDAKVTEENTEGAPHAIPVVNLSEPGSPVDEKEEAEEELLEYDGTEDAAAPEQVQAEAVSGSQAEEGAPEVTYEEAAVETTVEEVALVEEAAEDNQPAPIAVWEGVEEQNEEGEYDNQQDNYDENYENENGDHQLEATGDEVAEDANKAYENTGYEEFHAIVDDEQDHVQQAEETYVDETVDATAAEQAVPAHADNAEHEAAHDEGYADEDEENYGEGSPGNQPLDSVNHSGTPSRDTASVPAQDDDELIDYDEEEDDAAEAAYALQQSTPQKREREEGGQESDGQVDENQSSKRARAE